MTKRRLVKDEETRKAAEAVLIAQVCGALLLLPPLINLFNTRTLLLGVPLEFSYLFLVWILLIACAVVISASMPKASSDAQSEEEMADVGSEVEGSGE